MRTSMTMSSSPVGGLCTAAVIGRNNGCQWPKVASAEISLCARHLHVAHEEAEAVGLAFLRSIIRAEEAGS